MKVYWKISGIIILFLLTVALLPAQVVVIKSGGTFVNKNNLVVSGSWVNNGNFIDNSGTIFFNGIIQTVGGSSASSFNNLTIKPLSTTTIIAPGQHVRGVLLSNGTLNAGGNLTLVSTASQTSLIDGSGMGEVLGDISMQRYLPDAFGYKYVSSPFQSAVVGELSDDINLSASFPTFYEYVEDRVSAGWVNYTATTNILYPMEGYAANFGDVSHAGAFDLNGVVHNGTIQLTLYNHNQPYTQGFNLVGNPYPSPIDWDAVSGWTKANIDSAIYYFNASTTGQYTGTYSSYINGVSSDGTTNGIIPSMQGFFVHVTDGAYPVVGTLGASNSVRINALNPSYHKSAASSDLALLRLTAGFDEDEAVPDALAIYFDAATTTAFDSKGDALKLANTDENVPNFYSISSDAERLSVNAIPFPGEEMYKIPLGLNIEKSGNISFKKVDLQQMPAGLKIYFSDAVAGINQDLELNPEYTIYLDANQYDKRFYILFSYKAIENISNSGSNFSAYSSDGNVVVKIYSLPENSGKLMISNMLGQIIHQETINEKGTYEFRVSSESGIYVISLVYGNSIESRKIFIQN